MTKKLRLENKVVLITGASRGIGKEIALCFAREGAVVAINYTQSQDLAEEVCQTIQSNGGRCMGVQGDLGDSIQVNQMIEKVLLGNNKIDILVNNAGVLKLMPTLDTLGADFDRMIDVNLKGILHCSRAVSDQMKGLDSGRIINVSSIAALGTSMSGTTGYAITKSAVNMLTRRLALELGPDNITVNAIAPGFITTDMSLEGARATGTELSSIASRTMLKRVGQPMDIARVALFLASEDSAYMTGQVITVDGGRVDYLTHSV